MKKKTTKKKAARPKKRKAEALVGARKRFEENTTQSEDCVLWGGGEKFRFGGKQVAVRRMALFFDSGEMPTSGVRFRTICNNTRCVAVKHIINQSELTQPANIKVDSCESRYKSQLVPIEDQSGHDYLIKAWAQTPPCAVWSGAARPRYMGKQASYQAVGYVIATGEWPKGDKALALCGTKGCGTPEHMVPEKSHPCQRKYEKIPAPVMRPTMLLGGEDLSTWDGYPDNLELIERMYDIQFNDMWQRRALHAKWAPLVIADQHVNEQGNMVQEREKVARKVFWDKVAEHNRKEVAKELRLGRPRAERATKRLQEKWAAEVAS